MFTHMTLTTYSLLDQTAWHVHLADMDDQAEEVARETFGGYLPLAPGERSIQSAASVLRGVADALERISGVPGSETGWLP